MKISKGISLFSVVPLALFVLSACAREERPRFDLIQKSLAATESRALVFRIPAGAAVSSFAIVAGESIDLSDRASIQGDALLGVPELFHPEEEAQATTYAPIANLGSGHVEVGADAAVGSVSAAGGAFLRERATVHGDLTLGGAMTHQSQWEVTGTTSLGVPMEAQEVRWVVDVPAVQQPKIRLEPGVQLAEPVPPGRYEALEVMSGARLRLTAGEYFFRRVQLEPQGTLDIDDSSGRVTIHVDEQIDIKGTLAPTREGATNLVWGYWGQGTIFATKPLLGWVVAPGGRINLENTGAAGAHTGTFIAKSVRVAPDTRVHHPASSWLVTDITLSDPEVCLGESVEVHVEASDPAGISEVTVSINGVPGSSLVTQAARVPGPALVAVTVSDGRGLTETRLVTYEQVECEGSVFPKVGAAQSPSKPGVVEIHVQNAEEFDDGTQSYLYDFGDGTTATSPYPVLEHDYTSAIDRDQETGRFEVEVTVQRPGLADAVGRRTFVVWNDYAMSKKRGKIEPLVVVGERVLDHIGTSYSGSFSIENREDGDIELTESRRDLIPCDSQGAPVFGALEPYAATIPGGTTSSFDISMQESAIGEACGVVLNYLGHSAAGIPVHAAAHFVVQQPLQTQPAVSWRLRNLLNYVADQGLVAQTDRISGHELRLLTRQGRVPASVAVEDFYQADEPSEGDRCDPGSPGTAPSGGYQCLPTKDFVSTTGGGDTIANALKGDTVVIHGCTMVQHIFRGLDPAQVFTHSGMMVGHRDLIRQSTGSESWLLEQTVADDARNGLEENALRYFWPGTITSTVGEAFRGFDATSPEGVPHRLSFFSSDPARCPGDGQLVFPRVIKPPTRDEPTTRPLLQDAADYAASLDGHYRVSAYSQGDQLDTPDPTPPAWPGRNPTRRTVCSGLTRLALVESGLAADPDPTACPENSPFACLPSDVGGLAEGHDGLFRYTASERLNAATNLFQFTYDQVSETLSEASWYESLGAKLLYRVRRDIPNQFVNCFVNDECRPDTDDGSGYKVDALWKNPGEGFGVSPMNIFNHYDTPDAGGVYGSSERLIYVSENFRRVYTWQKVTTTQDMPGIVYHTPDLTAVPLEGATVSYELNGTDVTQSTDAAGLFEFLDVSDGPHIIRASKTVGGVLLTGETCVRAEDGGWRYLNCQTLEPSATPPQPGIILFVEEASAEVRTVRITGEVEITDCNCGVAKDEVRLKAVEALCDAAPGKPGSFEFFDGSSDGLYCVEDAGFELKGNCELTAFGSVRIWMAEAHYHRSNNSCGDNRKKADDDFSYTIPMDDDWYDFSPPDLSKGRGCFAAWCTDRTTWQSFRMRSCPKSGSCD